MMSHYNKPVINLNITEPPNVKPSKPYDKDMKYSIIMIKFNIIYFHTFKIVYLIVHNLDYFIVLNALFILSLTSSGFVIV